MKRISECKQSCRLVTAVIWFRVLVCFGADSGNAGTATAVITETNNTTTVEALVGEALQSNPELKFYQAEILAAKAGRKTAGLLSNPEISGTVGHERSTDNSGLAAEGVAWSVQVMQPFEWPGRIGLRKAIANRDVELAQIGLERFRVALAGRVRTLGYGLFAAQEKAAAAQEVAERFAALRETLIQREPAGLTPLLETRVIEATELTMQKKASEAKLAAQAALFELNQLRGHPPESKLSVEQSGLNFPKSAELNELLGLARTNNFELRVRAVELAQQGFRVALARNERFPSLSVGPTVSEDSGLERNRVIGVGVSFPLPIWNRNSGNIETAEARRVQAEVSYAVSQREVERQVAEAALTYQTKVGEMGRWRADSIQHFREAAEVADRHYRLGAVPLATYVELQKQYLEAVESLLDTKREALEASEKLHLLTGREVIALAAEKPKEEPK
jgi:outer membrane protein, heavy metal efflux system